MAKKIMEHIIIGLAIGFVVTTISLWCFKVYEAPGITVMREFTTWLFASALYGIISLIYDTDTPFPLSLIIHFVACAAVTFAASFISGIMNFMNWYEWFMYVLPVFVLIYIVIGAITTMVTRCQAKKINKKMTEKLDEK